jgi:predicted HicB family RNase H-like nuclease
MIAMKQHALRLPDDIAEAIDKRAKSVGLSRNAWITKALAWAVDQPIRTTTKTEKL